MKNNWYTIKIANPIAPVQLKQAIQHYIIQVNFQAPPKTGQLILDVVRRKKDQYGIPIQDGYQYDSSDRRWDFTPKNQQQKFLLKQYKQKKKQFINHIRTSSQYQHRMQQMYDDCKKMIQKADPTFNYQNANGNSIGGKYAQIILNLIKSRQLGNKISVKQIRQYFKQWDYLQKWFKTKLGHQIQQAKIFKNMDQLWKGIQKYRNIIVAASRIKESIDRYHKNYFEEGITSQGKAFKDTTDIQQWIAKTAINQKTHVFQDQDSIIVTLDKFIKLVQRNQIKINKSIKDYTFQQLSDTVSTFQQDLPQVQPTQHGKLILEDEKPISHFGQYKLYKFTDKHDVQQIGEGTTWCTRKQRGDNCQASGYLSNYGCVYVVTKNDQVILQMLPNMSQFMDINNRNVKEVVWKKNDKDLKNTLLPFYKRAYAQQYVSGGMNGNLQRLGQLTGQQEDHEGYRQFPKSQVQQMIQDFVKLKNPLKMWQIIKSNNVSKNIDVQKYIPTIIDYHLDKTYPLDFKQALYLIQNYKIDPQVYRQKMHTNLVNILTFNLPYFQEILKENTSILSKMFPKEIEQYLKKAIITHIDDCLLPTAKQFMILSVKCGINPQNLQQGIMHKLIQMFVKASRSRRHFELNVVQDILKLNGFNFDLNLIKPYVKDYINRMVLPSMTYLEDLQKLQKCIPCLGFKTSDFQQQIMNHYRFQHCSPDLKRQILNHPQCGISELVLQASQQSMFHKQHMQRKQGIQPGRNWYKKSFSLKDNSLVKINKNINNRFKGKNIK